MNGTGVFRCMIDVVIAPVSAQQIYIGPFQPPPAPPLDPTDQRIVEAVRETGRVKLWSLLNWLTEDEAARSRAEGRVARLSLWERIKRLKRLKVIYGVGRNEIAATKPVAKPSRPRTRQRKRSAGRLPRIRGVSAVNPAAQGQRPEIKYPVGFQVSGSRGPITSATTDSTKTETVITPEYASEAGRALAKMPRKQVRKPTGFLHGEHCWRKRPVVLSTGEVAPLIWCNRGRVLLQNVRNLPFREWLAWGAIREHQVKLWKNPMAVILGSRKRGVRGRTSDRKRISARRNGAAPARRGRWGRPRLTPDGAEVLPRLAAAEAAAGVLAAAV